MMENKRSPCSVEQSSLTDLATKRHKANSLSLSTKERKEKISEKVVALQQLVSPYGKSDNASVLLEAMEYIEFLHEQVKVLSAPYLRASAAAEAQMQDVEEWGMRKRGLCVVPITSTVGVDRTNGADLWAPIKTSSNPNI